MPKFPPTPPELHELLVHFEGDAESIPDEQLAEIGVSREHAEDYARFLRESTAAANDPLAMSGDDLASFAYWRNRYDEEQQREE
jgi:hypothetical protein